MITGIGSFPFTDVDKAIDIIFETCPEIPFWPQLPKRAPYENMYIPFLEGVPCVVVDENEGTAFMDTENPEGIEEFYEHVQNGNLEASRISEKVAPGYNVMGVAKAALESSVRYLAYDLGPQGVRVNAISAGPIRTLAAAGVSRFKDMYRHFTKLAPLQQHVTIEDIGEVAVFLCSDMASKITGEVLYVDSGYNIIGVPEPPECE